MIVVSRKMASETSSTLPGDTAVWRRRRVQRPFGSTSVSLYLPGASFSSSNADTRHSQKHRRPVEDGLRQQGAGGLSAVVDVTVRHDKVEMTEK
jgi:hypothetical protein